MTAASQRRLAREQRALALRHWYLAGVDHARHPDAAAEVHERTAALLERAARLHEEAAHREEYVAVRRRSASKASRHVFAWFDKAPRRT